MGAVNTNSVSLAITEEQSIGVLPATVMAEYMEPNEITDYGSDITTVARNPISKDRQNRKGTITELTATTSIGMDTTASHLLQILPGAMFANWYPQQAWLRGDVSAVDGGSFAITGGDYTKIHAGDILFARGFHNGANNGIFIVSSATASSISVTASTTVAETGSDSTSLYVVGHQFQSGDLAVDAGGNLTTTGFDLTTLGLTVGQGVYVGGLTDSTTFETAANTGLARVRNITASKITLDKHQQAFSADDGDGKTVQLYYGWFLRNVPTDHAKFKEHYYQFELTYPGLGSSNEDSYEYSVGNLINTMELSLPLSDKSTVSFETFAKDVEDITTERKIWTIKNPLFTEAYSTTSDFLRLRIQNTDETGLTTLFKEATLSINNNAGGENVLNKLGPEFVNYGNFDVTLSSSAVFTNAAVVQKIRNNCTVTMDFCIYNNDAGFYFDVPTMTLGDGNRDFAVNEKVKISLSSNAFGDPTLGYTLSVTFFPYLPSTKAAVCN